MNLAKLKERNIQFIFISLKNVPLQTMSKQYACQKLEPRQEFIGISVNRNPKLSVDCSQFLSQLWIE